MELKENLLRGIYAYGEAQPPHMGTGAGHLKSRRRPAALQHMQPD